MRSYVAVLTQAHVHDIEELVALGKEMHVCPYFGARRAVADAQLIALPYNLLLQQDAREALALHLDDSVIIIDEAHNLIDTLLGTYSVEVSEAHLAQAAQQVTAYLDRFAMQLKGTNEEHLRTLQVFLTAAQAYCVHAKAPDALSTADFVARLGGSVDQINVRGASHSPSSFGSNYGSKKRASRVRYAAFSPQISGYADRLWLRAHPHDPPSRHTHVHAMHLVERLLLALGDRTRNGRILVARRPDGRVGIKYILLNPADAFQPLLDAARSVVLAGGTMAPIAEFERQLFAHDPARFTSYSCGHIVAPANVLGAVVASGPKGVPLEFTHAAWDNAALLDELGNALSNYCNLVPHGMIVFFPSYTNLHKTLAHWRSTRLLERLAKRKRVFQEPTDAHDVEAVLQGYAAAIASPTVRRTLTQPDAPKGAILFAVVNAKLSEGINFQDDLARCVVMVGLPFPNAHSPELAERMAYMRQLDPHAKTDLGRDLYLNLCMRAVNQSMGRAIRHEHDYVRVHGSRRPPSSSSTTATAAKRSPRACPNVRRRTHPRDRRTDKHPRAVRLHRPRARRLLPREKTGRVVNTHYVYTISRRPALDTLPKTCARGGHRRSATQGQSAPRGTRGPAHRAARQCRTAHRVPSKRGCAWHRGALPW